MRRSDASLMASCDDNHLSLKRETASADINTTWETSPITRVQATDGKVEKSRARSCLPAHATCALPGNLRETRLSEQQQERKGKDGQQEKSIKGAVVCKHSQ